MSERIVHVRNLEKTYETGSERLTILRGLNFDAEAGRKVSIVGRSGSGKSTFLNILGGLDSPTGGTVVCGGRDVASLGEEGAAEYRSRFLGLIFQFHYLLKDFTALENVLMPALMAGVPKKEAKEKAAAILADVGMGERMGHLPGELSGGERQRVAVARSLINDPSLILADEPTGNLDPANSEMIGSLLFSMAEKRAKTLILVTHDMNLAKKADDVYTIQGGKLSRAERA